MQLDLYMQRKNLINGFARQEKVNSYVPIVLLTLIMKYWEKIYHWKGVNTTRIPKCVSQSEMLKENFLRLQKSFNYVMSNLIECKFVIGMREIYLFHGGQKRYIQFILKEVYGCFKAFDVVTVKIYCPQIKMHIEETFDTKWFNCVQGLSFGKTCCQMYKILQFERVDFQFIILTK